MLWNVATATPLAASGEGNEHAVGPVLTWIVLESVDERLFASVTVSVAV